MTSGSARQRGRRSSRTRRNCRSGGFPGIIEELAAAKVTLSTVAIGEKPDVELMADLATWGNGRSYVAESDAEVPTLFAAETRRLLGDAIVEDRSVRGKG